MSRLEASMRIVLEFKEAFNRHDVTEMIELLSDDCVFENNAPAPDGSVIAGKESMAQFWGDFFKASPQARIEIEEIFSAGLRCVMRWRYEGEDTAGFTDQMRGVDLFKVENGSIRERMSYVKG